MFDRDSAGGNDVEDCVVKVCEVLRIQVADNIILHADTVPLYIFKSSVRQPIGVYFVLRSHSYSAGSEESFGRATCRRVAFARSVAIRQLYARNSCKRVIVRLSVSLSNSGLPGNVGRLPFSRVGMCSPRVGKTEGCEREFDLIASLGLPTKICGLLFSFTCAFNEMYLIHTPVETKWLNIVINSKTGQIQWSSRLSLRSCS